MTTPTRPSADLTTPTQRMQHMQQMQQNSSTPESSAIVHFADAPNGDVWLALRTANGAVTDIRRVPADEMWAVIIDLRLAASGDLPPTPAPDTRTRLSIVP